MIHSSLSPNMRLVNSSAERKISVRLKLPERISSIWHLQDGELTSAFFTTNCVMLPLPATALQSVKIASCSFSVSSSLLLCETIRQVIKRNKRKNTKHTPKIVMEGAACPAPKYLATSVIPLLSTHNFIWEGGAVTFQLSCTQCSFGIPCWFWERVANDVHFRWIQWPPQLFSAALIWSAQ